MQPDIVLLVCDTARADAFSPWGRRQATPVLQRLSERATVYTQATATAPWTVPSIASMFSGLLPSEHGISGDCISWLAGLPTSPAGAVRAFPGSWLPELMRERGYRTWAASCNSWITQWGGFDRGFDTMLEFHDSARFRGAVGRTARPLRRLWGKEDQGGRASSAAFANLLAQAGPEPIFAFADLMETHQPYDPPRPYFPYPPWKRISTRPLSRGQNRFLAYNLRFEAPDGEFVRTIRELYFTAASYVDHILGLFVRAIEHHARPTVLIVVSDHGEHLAEHGLFGHNSSLYQELLRVPLLVWGQTIEMGQDRIDAPVSLLGLCRMVVELAEGSATLLPVGGPVLAEYESTVRHGLPAEIAARLTEHGRGTARPLVEDAGLAVREGRWKMVVTENGTEELYDLEADPGEERDVAPRSPDAIAGFRSVREAWASRRAARPVYAGGVAPEGEIEEHLRALGYIE